MYLCIMKTIYFLLVTILFCGCQTIKSGFVLTADGGRIYYEECGKGEPIIFLHGHSLDRRMWDEQFKPFSKKYRTIRMDFRGYGRSSEQREDLQFTHVDDVIALMDSFHIQKAHVIGLSMGAFVAGDMLAIYPERLLTCTMASAGIRNCKGPSEPMDSAESAKRDREIEALKQKGIDTMKKEWIEQLLSSGGSHRERMRKPLTQMIQDWSAWQPLHKEVRLFYGKEAWAKLRERGTLDIPVLLIRGENEHKTKRTNPNEMRYLSNASFVVIDDCGHMLNMERPTAFNQAVLQFLSDKKQFFTSY